MKSRALLILGLVVGSNQAGVLAQGAPPAAAPAAPAVSAPAAPAAPAPAAPVANTPAPAAPAPPDSTVVVAEPIPGADSIELNSTAAEAIVAPAPVNPTTIGAVTAGQTFEQRTAILMNNFHSVLATAKTTDQISSLSNQVQAELDALIVVQNQRIIEQNARIIELLERQGKTTPAPTGN